MDKNEKAVLATLCYSDIFEYPLTKEEIGKYLITPSSLRGQSVAEAILALEKQKRIARSNNYYSLNGRESLFKKRIERRKISDEKFIKAKNIALFLANIPTVQCVGISGSLAMENAQEDDDIDLCILVKRQTLWTTRLLILLLLELMGMRRKRQDKKAPNKVCINMWIDESVLELPQSFHTLYGAHEIVQLIPLINKNQTYQKFIKANMWVKNFLPNTMQASTVKREALSVLSDLSFLSNLIEQFSRKMQLFYMKSHITSEYISSTLLAFHPKDNKSYIMKEYKKRIDIYV